MTKYTADRQQGTLGTHCPLIKKTCHFECSWFIGSDRHGDCTINKFHDTGLYDMLNEVRASINSVANNLDR